ncbi:hypothetical protein [Mucilaginibacter paludis]|uniref:Uncharacterized protein n=1 Tax=Mucilaginibacter paludis DSM 18603 TaxID=714943 RepID=H1YCD1_9SPHI|nr:hypothetical protein [Mucilaginibacter paludis]EHQ30122.1 hypothetical protein Mucpa_6064 [Mucilaginibacter paludis DSM 18603]
MAIDFYDLGDVHFAQLLFKIEHHDFDCLKDVWLGLKNATGIYIDQYGKTRIYPTQVKLIASLIKEHLEKISSSDEKAKRPYFFDLYNKFVETEGGLIALGD